MSIEATDPRIVYLPEDKILDGTGHCDVMRNRWFCIHPERGLMFWQAETRRRKGSLVGAAPQCNTNEAIARDIQSRLFPWAEVKFFPVVIVPIDAHDFV